MKKFPISRERFRVCCRADGHAGPVPKPISFHLAVKWRPRINTVIWVWIAEQGASFPLGASWWAPKLEDEKVQQYNQQPQRAASHCHFDHVTVCVCARAGLFCQKACCSQGFAPSNFSHTHIILSSQRGCQQLFLACFWEWTSQSWQQHHCVSTHTHTVAVIPVDLYELVFKAETYSVIVSVYLSLSVTARFTRRKTHGWTMVNTTSTFAQND